MPLRYEDTVAPEIAPCDECGALTDEHYAEFWGVERICKDCGDQRREDEGCDHTGEDG